MDDESLCELMGRVAALEAALSAILSSSGIDAAVRAGALASLEKMAAVFELGGQGFLLGLAHGDPKHLCWRGSVAPGAGEGT